MEHKCNKTDVKSIEKCELNRTQIISELEELGKFITCPEYINDALRVIEELAEKNAIQTITAIELDKQVQRLTEENERLRAEVADLQDELKCEKETNEHLCGEYMSAKADTVRKMQEQLKMEIESFGRKDGWVTKETALWFIDQIAKEMLEGKQ